MSTQVTGSVGSKDGDEISVPGGHIGLFVGRMQSPPKLPPGIPVGVEHHADGNL